MKILFPLLMVLVMSTSGCALLIAGAVGGAGTAVWISNKLSQDVDQPSGQVVRAVEEALKELKLPLSKETRSSEMVQIRSEYSSNDPVWIDVHIVSPKRSRLEVRVGVTGNELATQKLFDTIIKNL